MIQWCVLAVWNNITLACFSKQLYQNGDFPLQEPLPRKIRMTVPLSNSSRNVPFRLIWFACDDIIPQADVGGLSTELWGESGATGDSASKVSDAIRWLLIVFIFNVKACTNMKYSFLVITRAFVHQLFGRLYIGCWNYYSVFRGLSSTIRWRPSSLFDKARSQGRDRAHSRVKHGVK